jgi:hypothetical protein
MALKSIPARKEQPEEEIETGIDSLTEQAGKYNWIDHDWQGTLPNGLEGRMAQLTRIGHGLSGIEDILSTDHNLREASGRYTPLDNLVAEDLRSARAALIHSLNHTLSDIKTHLKEFPVALVARS